MQRIDHGVKCLEDSKLITHLKDVNMALTVCPLSNLEVSQRLQIFSTSSLEGAPTSGCLGSSVH